MGGADTAAPVTAALLAGLLAGYGIAVPVGAVGAYLVSLTARTSPRTGVCAALGIATADGCTPSPPRWAALPSRRSCGRRSDRCAGSVCWCCRRRRPGAAATAVRQYRGHRLATRTGAAPPGPARACPALLGITLLNPTTVIYFAALVPGSRSGDAAGFPERAVFVAAAFAASASRQVLLAGGGGRALTGRRGRLATALVASAVMTALALRMAVAAG